MTTPADCVYLDYAATTPLAPEAAAAMQEIGALAANPASTHPAGRAARALVERARGQLADLLNTDPATLVWTSGATEANNLAIAGVARCRAHRGRHLVTMRTEHKSVTDVCAALEREGWEVSWLPPDADGRLSPAVLEGALRDDTALVSVMYVNNETGVIQDIERLGAACRARDVLFHCDAAQAAGRLPLDLSRLPLDLVSLTAHKMYGPQGIGALYLADRPGCRLFPLMHGGAQERRLRPGTLPVRLAAGFGAAAAVAACRREEDAARVRRLGERLWRRLSVLPELERNGKPEHAWAGILNVSAAGVEGESLLLALEPVCVARGSACNAESGEASHVLRALGRSDALAQSAVRFSFGRGTTDADIDTAADRYVRAVERLRALAPASAA